MNGGIDKPSNPDDRVTELLSLYSNPQASAAYFLCDRHDPDSIAYTIVAPDMTSVHLRYGALRSESEKLAAALSSLGLQSGDRVATLMGKSREYLVALMAIWRLGAVQVPLFTAFAPPAIHFRLSGSRCRLVICDAAQRSKLTPEMLPSRIVPFGIVTTGAPDDGALSFHELVTSGPAESMPRTLSGNSPIIHIYTSGTTGTPKAVVVPLRAIACTHIYAEYALALREDDVFWNAADPGWAYGLYFGILATLVSGVRGILVEGGFSVETTLGVLSDHAVSNFAAAPTVFRALRASAQKPRSSLRLRCASSAGEPLTAEVNDWAVAALGVPVHDHYGQTETGMIVNNHHHPALRRPLKPGSMGRSMPGWTTAILKPDADELASEGAAGRLAVDLTRSPLAWFEGYADDHRTTSGRFSADGRWYITGDTARMDSEGCFYFSARDDDVIIMAGYRIGPFDVESVLLTHPAVSECAVIAASDEIRGEVLQAAVVLRTGYGASDELTHELQGWVKTRFAAHAYPRRIHYLKSLPKTPSGKLQRYVLRQQLREQQHRD